MPRPAPLDARLPRTGKDVEARVEVELTVGDSVQIGETVCTIVEIVDGEVHLRVDPAVGSEVAADGCRFAAVAR